MVYDCIKRYNDSNEQHDLKGVPMANKKKIEDFCRSLGLDTFGFIPCRTFQELQGFYEKRIQEGTHNEFEEADVLKRIDPRMYMEEGKTLLSIAFPYCDEKAHKGNANGFSIYTKRMDYHKVVKSYLDQICGYIEELGGKAVGLVDSNALPERYIAYLAGVGFIGKNNMLITKKYGSYVFLGEIIINLEIDCEDRCSFDEIQDYKECGMCTRCIGECPTKAINMTKRNANNCLSYLTQKKELTDQEISLLKGNVFGCDFCQKSCPYNEQSAHTPLAMFATLDYMEEDVECYASMDNKYFKEKISRTSCGWRGKNVIKRNALIAMKYEGQKVSGFKGDSPYLNNYIERLENQE